MKPYATSTEKQSQKVWKKEKTATFSNIEGKAQRLVEAVKESTPLQEHKKRKWISEQTLELAKDKRPLKLRAQDPETKQKCRLQPTKKHQQERTRKNG